MRAKMILPGMGETILVVERASKRNDTEIEIEAMRNHLIAVIKVEDANMVLAELFETNHYDFSFFDFDYEYH